MKFTDLIDNYLRDYINEGITLDIISLIKTIKECEDIEEKIVLTYGDTSLKEKDYLIIDCQTGGFKIEDNADLTPLI